MSAVLITIYADSVYLLLRRLCTLLHTLWKYHISFTLLVSQKTAKLLIYHYYYTNRLRIKILEILKMSVEKKMYKICTKCFDDKPCKMFHNCSRNLDGKKVSVSSV